ncbi:MAG TPA: zinc-ribbon domain-containing protein [Ktedonobacteraceae bacterium]
MYRCPRCNVELSPDARFCPRCGFNQTNARMQKVAPQQAARSNTPVTPTPTPVTPAPSINPGTPTDLPPTPLTPPAPSLRSLQPEVKRTIPPRPTPNEQAGPPTLSVRPLDPPASPSIQGIRQPISPTPTENRQQKENKDAVPPSSIRPVKTNTPPKPGKIAPTTPPPLSGLAASQPAAIPAHLTALAPEELAKQGERPKDAKLEDKQLSADEAKAQGLSLTKRYVSEQETRHQPAFPEQAASLTVQNQPQPGERPKGANLEDKQPSADEGKAQGFSLTKRYVSEQETRHQPAFPINNAVSIPTDMSPVRQMQNDATLQSPDMQRAVGAMPTIPPPKMAQDFDPFTGEGAESLIATSKAAEHWRQSWRDRQHDEAGPAVGITRGQADVPEPLMAMQHSIARMRAIILPKNTGNTPGKNFGFWVTLILLLCIIGGLCAYVISTYAPSAQLAAQISGAGSVSPTLTLKGTHTNTIKAGQTLHLHGTYFGPNHAITFILDTTPLSTNPVQSNNKGAFDTSLAIPATWLAGNYALQAQDNQSGLHAFLDLQILPSTPAMSNNTPLVLTINDQPLPTTGLKFQAVMGKINETSQRITLTNSGDVPVQWSASALADNNLNWLVINDGHIGGTLDIQGTDSIGISVNTVGLTSSTKPYLGSFILTINQTQAIVPVSLTVQNTSLEVVVNPNPVIAYLQGGAGTCKPTTLTLINLSSQVVTWNANPYDIDKPHIHLDNLTTDQGTLDPEGLPNDTKVIQITCIGAQAGEKLYHISVYYNGVAVNVPVTVRFA